MREKRYRGRARTRERDKKGRGEDWKESESVKDAKLKKLENSNF